MAPWSVHPFHHIRYLRPGFDSRTLSNSPAGLSPVAAFKPPEPGSISADLGKQPPPLDGRKPSSFSELGTIPRRHRGPASSSSVPAEYHAYWKLAAALDRLDAPLPERRNTPLPEPPNAVTIQRPDGSDLPEPRNRSKRRADSQASQPKRVRLTYSTASSSAGEGSHSSSAFPSNPDTGASLHQLPLTGVVIFVDMRCRDGSDISNHWGGILRNLGAKVMKTFAQKCTHVVFNGGRKSTLNTYMAMGGRRPTVVGIEWVDRCRKEHRFVDEGKYLVDLANLSADDFKVGFSADGLSTDLGKQPPPLDGRKPSLSSELVATPRRCRVSSKESLSTSSGVDVAPLDSLMDPIHRPQPARPISETSSGPKPTAGSSPTPSLLSSGTFSRPGTAAVQGATCLSDTTDHISCCGCGERRPFCTNTDILAKHIRCLSCNKLHHHDCLKFSYGFIYCKESANSWLCPACSSRPLHRWHDSFVGCFILLEAPCGKTKKLYPAEIVSRDVHSPLVNLRWYCGSSLPAKLRSEGFQVLVSLCIEALFRDLGVSPQPIGGVRIPVRILEDSGIHDIVYSNPAIESAMEEAFSTILSIALATHHHPLWDLFRQWTKSNGTSGRKIRTASDFISSHPVPILPGDAALSETLLARLVRYGVSDRDAIFVIARTLLGLVILRTYLKLQPSHDGHIWKVWLEGGFKRRLTPAEGAYEACTMTRTGVDTDGAIRSIPSRGLHRLGLQITPCEDPCTEDDSLLVNCPHISWEQGQDYQLSGPRTTGTPGPTAKPRPLPVKRKRKPDDSDERVERHAPPGGVDCTVGF